MGLTCHFCCERTTVMSAALDVLRLTRKRLIGNRGCVTLGVLSNGWANLSHADTWHGCVTFSRAIWCISPSPRAYFRMFWAASLTYNFDHMFRQTTTSIQHA